MTGEHVVLLRVPGARIDPGDFELRPGPPITDPLGDVTVAAQMFGLNAGLRTRLGTGRSTTLGPAITPGDTPQSDAIGIVTESSRSGLRPGDLVTGLLPWAHVATIDGSRLRVLAPHADPIRWLTVLGHVGLTAYSGLVSVANLRAGETVWIPAAAGGVGSCAVQIAQRLGAHVVASAGSEARLAYLVDTLGVTTVVDRRADLVPQLRRHAPDGLDVYLDLVGGDHLRSALDCMRERGRIVVTGNAGPASSHPVLADTAELIRRRLSIIAMSVTDHLAVQAPLEAFVEAHQEKRPFVPTATLHHGLNNLPRAFSNVLAGDVLGRGVVDVSHETGHGPVATPPSRSQP